MRILLDEQLPRQLAPYLNGHDARTVQQESWAGLKNGVLLTSAEAAGFDVFLTGDQNLEFQQNISTRRLGVVSCAPRATRLRIWSRSFRKRWPQSMLSNLGKWFELRHNTEMEPTRPLSYARMSPRRAAHFERLI